MKLLARCLIGTLALAASTTLRAQDTLEARYQAKLDEAVANLAREREAIQTERVPLAQELREAQESTAQLQREVERLQRRRQDEARSLEELRGQVHDQGRQAEHIARRLLPEALQAWEDRALPHTWTTRLRPAMENYRALLGEPSGEPLNAGLDLFGQAIAELEGALGGRIQPGQAVDQDGRIHAGRLVEWGPLLYFLGDDLSGPALSRSNSLHPVVDPFSSRPDQDLRALVSSGEGRIPVLAVAPDHPALNRKPETLAGHLRKGGIWVIPILLFAGVATVVALAKSWQISRIRRTRPGLIQEMVAAIRKNDLDQALRVAAGQPAPIGPMLASAAEHAHEPAELVEEIMYEAMLDVQPRLESGLNAIAVTAAAAPLLGLLGTVTGIIKTFSLMSLYGAGDPRPLIAGISEALITTELGLLLAIPALVIHALLQRRVSAIMADMEKHAVTFLNALARKES